METKSAQTQQNAMELLVAEEIDSQICTYSTKLSQYINRTEVATYALNRLPPLYASSQEGLCWQQKRARKELKNQIQLAVKQGFAAVQRDPLRRSTPLIDSDRGKAQDAEQCYFEWTDSRYSR